VSIEAAGKSTAVGTGTGATIGAAVGVGFPPLAPITTAIGAGLGAVVGFFGGLFKKKDKGIEVIQAPASKKGGGKAKPDGLPIPLIAAGVVALVVIASD
jgi:hypothetical protein